MAALGTPDPGTDNGTSDCNILTAFTKTTTGSRAGCVSDAGAFDMIGNMNEFVADWVPFSTACPGWGGLTNDHMCLAGASTTALGPGALLRGGAYNNSTFAGVFAVNGDVLPTGASVTHGFRCARDL
jgi:formylglycine-generating enzyme required for sulfatase activity